MLNSLVTQLQAEVQNLDQRQKQLQAQQKTLDGHFNDSSKTLTLLHTQLNDVTTIFGELGSEIEDQVEASVLRWTEQINDRLLQIRPFDYRLVFDRPGSRTELMKALQQTQKHLILVCPWPTIWGIDSQVFKKLEVLLKQNVSIQIGWGCQKDIDKLKNGTGTIRQRLKSYSDYYNALPQLEILEQEYPCQFKMKLLGTHEKFLVCDRSWAMIGSHNFLTSDDRKPEREAGLFTNDPRLIEDLISRFHNAENLELQLSSERSP